MIYHLLIAVFAIFALMAGWILIQAWERRQSFDPSADCDVLSNRMSCIGCVIRGRCRKVGENAE